jgi:hypothetical protein
MVSPNKLILFIIFTFIFLGCATKNNSIQDQKIYEESGGYPIINFADERRRIFEESGGYSIIPPESWEAIEVPGFDYKLLVGQKKYNFTPNIGFYMGMLDGKLNESVDGALRGFDVLFNENYTLLQRGDFFTTKNLKGEKIIISVFMLGQHFRQAVYYFPGQDNLFIQITCSVPAEFGDNIDRIFDKTLETFEWVNKNK